MNKKGVTLVELIVVMVIIAILASLTVPSIGAWLPNYRLRSATRDIVSTMRDAQMKAVKTGNQYRVSFNIADTGLTNNTAYILQYNTAGIILPDGAVTRLPTGITVTVNTLPGLCANFNPSPPSDAGTLTLVNLKGSQKAININGATGRTRIQ
jgi:type IV fimbrial biogenesis protein FimT